MCQVVAYKRLKMMKIINRQAQKEATVTYLWYLLEVPTVAL